MNRQPCSERNWGLRSHDRDGRGRQEAQLSQLGFFFAPWAHSLDHNRCSHHVRNKNPHRCCLASWDRLVSNRPVLPEAPAEKTTLVVAIPRGSGFLLCCLPDAFGNLDRPFFLDLVRGDVCRWTQVGCPTLSSAAYALRNLSPITLGCQRMGELVDPLSVSRFERPSPS